MEILKCKGHATELDVDEGRATIRRLNGNACADKFPVRGTIVAEARAPPSNTDFKGITAFYRYLHSFCDEWVPDTTADEDWIQYGPLALEPSSTDPELHATAPHELVSRWGLIKCARCKKTCKF